MVFQSQDKPSVLVVGAGPVGLALACELYRHGVACRIVDKAEGTTKWSKALVVHARTMEIFERMEVLPKALELGRQVKGASIRAYDQEILHIDLTDLEAPHNFFLDLNQADTEAMLEARLRELGGSVEWQTEVCGIENEADEVRVQLSSPALEMETAEFAYVCACDGAHSFIRQALKLPFPGGRNAAQFLLADVKLKWDRSPDRWYADIHEDALFYAAALKEPGRWRIITELPRTGAIPPPDSLQKGESPTMDDLQLLLNHSGYDDIGAHDPAWLSWFKVNHRILDCFSEGRIFFAGDAAHLHPPVGGQGMNIGIHDAFNLGWKLALTLNGQANPNLLDTYSVERRPAAAGVVEFTEVALRSGLARSVVVRKLRDTLIGALDHVQPVKSRLERTLAEINVNYRESPIVGELEGDPDQPSFGTALLRWRGRVSSPKAGDRAPDAILLRRGEQPVRLFELTRGTGFHLLYFAPVSAESRGEELNDRLLQAFGSGVTLIEVGPAAEENGAHALMRDFQGSTRQAFGIYGEGAILIRPDGYIAARSDPFDLNFLLHQLAGMLKPRIALPSPKQQESGPSVPRLLLGVGAAAAIVGGVAWLSSRRQSPLASGTTGKAALAAAAVFTLSGTAKLAGSSAMRQSFWNWGYPPGFMEAVGLWEVRNAAALIDPRTRRVGAANLAALMIGAAGTHARARELSHLPPALGLLGLTGWIATDSENPSKTLQASALRTSK